MDGKRQVKLLPFSFLLNNHVIIDFLQSPIKITKFSPSLPYKKQNPIPQQRRKITQREKTKIET
jgi:hypothetical protein